MEGLRIDKIDEYSKQQVFDYVTVKLLKQGVKSAEEMEFGTKCFYRGPNDTCCAIGFLIPDDLYNSKIEGKSSSSAFEVLRLDIDESRRIFLRELQQVHDDKKPYEWKVYFEEIAFQHQLNTIALESWEQE